MKNTIISDSTFFYCPQAKKKKIPLQQAENCCTVLSVENLFDMLEISEQYSNKPVSWF